MNHFLPQSRDRLWIMGIRRDLVPTFSELDVTNFLLEVVDRTSKGNPRLSLNDVLLQEYHPSVAKVLDNAAVAPVAEPNPTKRLKWCSDNIDKLGVDVWLTNRLHVPEDMLIAHPGFKMLSQRQMDCLMARGLHLPTEQQIIANTNDSTDHMTITQDHIGTITPKGIYFMCDRVRQSYVF